MADLQLAAKPGDRYYRKSSLIPSDPRREGRRGTLNCLGRRYLSFGGSDNSVYLLHPFESPLKSFVDNPETFLPFLLPSALRRVRKRLSPELYIRWDKMLHYRWVFRSFPEGRDILRMDAWQVMKNIEKLKVWKLRDVRIETFGR